METWSKLLKGITASECLRSINADVNVRYVYSGIAVVYRQQPQKISVLKKPSYTFGELFDDFFSQT
ncbi:hypothetical protein [Lactobacillus sp. ESL0677]|uniref:hypothetical protein n=1 Tax=Lactobacillus sp. ESL0677 TaxID=2983208 RepID=UPI0032AF292C